MLEYFLDFRLTVLVNARFLVFLIDCATSNTIATSCAELCPPPAKCQRCMPVKTGVLQYSGFSSSAFTRYKDACAAPSTALLYEAASLRRLQLLHKPQSTCLNFQPALLCPLSCMSVGYDDHANVSRRRRRCDGQKLCALPPPPLLDRQVPNSLPILHGGPGFSAASQRLRTRRGCSSGTRFCLLHSEISV